MNDTRKRQLAAIHALAKDVGLGEPAYRNVLAAITGKRTAAGMSNQERRRVISFLAREKAELERALHADEYVSDEEASAILGGA